MLKEFARDYSLRLFRLALMAYFGGETIQSVASPLGFSAEDLTAAVVTLGLLGWSGAETWWKARHTKATKLLNKGQVTDAKIVAAGGRVEMSGRSDDIR